MPQSPKQRFDWVLKRLKEQLVVLERAELLADGKPLYEADFPETKAGLAGGKAGGQGRCKAAKTISSPCYSEFIAGYLGLSESSIKLLLRVALGISQSAKDSIRSTEIADNLTELLLLARMEPETQTETVELIQSGKASDVKDASIRTRRKERTEKLREICTGNQELNNGLGVFPVILADPPWRYEHMISESRAIENQYPTMQLEDICNLRVEDIATEDAILFVWATSSKLAEAVQVIGCWGFKYQTCLVWVKPSIGPGYYVRQRHELLLIATRGTMPMPDESSRNDSVVEAPRSKHSEKPEVFYEIMERMYPNLPKIELFCRSPRAGWAAWGNQSEGGSAHGD